MSHWRYRIESTQPSWTAIVFLDHIGCFAAFSSYGNFMYRFNPSEGKDFRLFIAECASDHSYFARKLGGREDADALRFCMIVMPKVAEAIRKEIDAEAHASSQKDG
jgi:hypothetical protein